MKEVAKHLAETNEYNYNILKAIEECTELATILTQHLTKGCNYQDIIDEIGDVKLRVKVLENLFNKDSIDKRIAHKAKKIEGYIKEGKYKNRI